MNKKFAINKEQEAFLIEHFPNKTNKEIAELMNFSISKVENQAYRLKLKKSAEYKAIHLRTFKKGHVCTHLKKGFCAAGSEKGWFKKGNIPHNTKTEGDGAITFRCHKTREYGYFYIRQKLGVWIELHRHIWQQANGDIPKGYNIIYKDNNSINCCIENLEILSNRELGKRNISLYQHKLNNPEQLSDQQIYKMLMRLKIMKQLNLSFEECTAQGLITAQREIILLNHTLKSIKNATTTA